MALLPSGGRCAGAGPDLQILLSAMAQNVVDRLRRSGVVFWMTQARGLYEDEGRIGFIGFSKTPSASRLLGRSLNRRPHQ